MAEMRTHVFVNTVSGEELVMPTYAEAGYKWRHGMGMETITMHQTGDMAVPTVRTLCLEPLEVLLPAHRYGFCTPGAILNPWYYIEILERWSDAKTILRYIVTGTPINAAVYISEIEPSEPDGTGDFRATIRLQEAKVPKAIPAASSLGLELNARDGDGSGAVGSTYTVVYGDTMRAIARKFYGDGSLCWRLAAYNNIPNANIIHPGQVLQIPPRDQLPAAAKAPARTNAQTAKETIEEAVSEPVAGKSPATKSFEAFASGPQVLPPVMDNLNKLIQTSIKKSGVTPTAINAMDRRVTGR